MGLTEALLVIALILVLIDIFFVSDVPTHIAYLLVTFVIAREIPMAMLYQFLFGILIWFGLVVFHYTLWSKVLERINDKWISPRKHIGGIEGLVGKRGTIKVFDDKPFLVVHGELYPYKKEDGVAVSAGQEYEVKRVDNSTLII